MRSHSLLEGDDTTLQPVPGSFEFQGGTYDYFHHAHNATWTNERAVEIPIVCAFMQGKSVDATLEVGNVLSHYFLFDHDIIDKYEAHDRAVNVDIVDFHPDRQYELIVSISTLEHVGWEEEPREPEKVRDAIEHLVSLLRLGGRLVFTVPTAYNAYFDELIRRGDPPGSRYFALKRVSPANHWAEIPVGELGAVRYGSPFRGANGIAVGVIDLPALT